MDSRKNHINDIIISKYSTTSVKKDYVVLFVCLLVCLFVCLMVFNATFNNISVISCRSVLLVEETKGPGKNHQLVGSQ